MVAANVPLWLERYPNAATKITISPANLPHLVESMIHVFSLGVRTIHANVVFEPVWRPGDEVELSGPFGSVAGLGREALRELHLTRAEEGPDSRYLRIVDGRRTYSDGPPPDTIFDPHARKSKLKKENYS